MTAYIAENTGGNRRTAQHRAYEKLGYRHVQRIRLWGPNNT